MLLKNVVAIPVSVPGTRPRSLAEGLAPARPCPLGSPANPDFRHRATRMESDRSEPGQPRVIFHIGAEKTGTTSFQRFCLENRAELLGRGWLYPTASFAFGKMSRNHAPLVAAYLTGAVTPDYSVAKVWRTREETLGSLFAEIEGAAAHSVLLSAEHFSSRFGAHQINQLSLDFARFRPKIVIVFRSHLEWMYSLYSTSVRNGSRLRYDELVRHLLPSSGLIVAYRLIVEQWAQAFGEHNLSLLHLREGEDVTELLTRAGILPVLREAYTGYRDNAGNDPRVIEVLRRTNEIIETRARRAASSYFQHRLTDLARTKIVERLNAISRTDRDQATFLMCADPILQRSLEGAIAQDEDWLRRNFGLDLAPVCASRARPAPTSAEIEASSNRLMKQLGFWGRGWLRVALFARGGALAPAESNTAP